ncbi:MAG: right-handed parallel beta-helix repeat-containing protein [Acidisphaera sp.]|nr:right-handed parallel beta-helix repeat-containing protein [Acidisphaera sp.]
MKTTVLLIALFSTLGAASASAQATRTWISGVGDDANPCSRTAPCKTFAGAQSKTAAGGEIDALDPGGFGTLTITKALTVDGGAGQVGAVLAASTDGITINAGTSDRVILRNLSINGISASTSPGLIGVDFVQAASLTLDNVVIMNFSQNCVSFQPASRATLVILGSDIENCGGGGLISSTTSSTGVNRVNIVASSFHRSSYGIMAGQNSDVAIIGGMVSNNSGAGLTASGSTAQITVQDAMVNNNQVAGISAIQSGTVRMANTSVSFTGGTGLSTDGTGQILSWGNNYVAGNTTDGSPTGTIAPK